MGTQPGDVKQECVIPGPTFADSPLVWWMVIVKLNVLIINNLSVKWKLSISRVESGWDGEVEEDFVGNKDEDGKFFY